ncbi:MAG: type II secretion system protein GspD [Candidatus Omnitrophica bacterium]|nr:type II secretion system protein GspD [Candidatus Omnitrophota bacterium]
MRRALSWWLVLILGSAMAESVAGLSPTAWAQSETAAGEEPVGPDQRFSLDLKGVDILDVLKLLSQKSGLSFVAGHNVTGRVTVFAKDVGVWEAFERIVEANELAYERTGDVISVMTAREYELLYGQPFQQRRRNIVIPLRYAKAEQVATVLNQLKSAVGQVVVDEPSNTVILTDGPLRLAEMERLVQWLDRPTETRVYPLDYADAEKLKEKTQEFLTPGVGLFTFDARTNTAIVTDVPEAVARIDQVIRAFDERDAQVLIEAKIIKVELTDEESLGIDWQRVFDGVNLQTRGNFRALSDIIGGSATGVALKFLSDNGQTQVIMEALKKFGKVDTVSNPRITVSDKQEARILVGTKEAVVTVTTTVPATGATVNAPQVQFVDVGTKLFVTPSIKRDGHVQLKVRPEVSTAKVETFQANRIPIVTTTEAETNVLVKSGATVVIGGLIDTKTERAQSQVPLLGRVPLLGAAFRSRVDSSRKTELVVFLTPQIVSTAGEPVTQFPDSALPDEPRAAGEREPPVPEAYQALLRALISARLAQALQHAAAGPGLVSLALTIARDGSLTGSPQIVSAQGEAFVQAAREALEALAPFPPFPDAVAADSVRFRLAVEYHPSS